ncbi:MAG: TadE/TadG family type IV pilus assembly protein [Isosphaeraceae bacterium]
MRRVEPKKRRRASSGVAAAEFAVCLPLVCLILTGLWQVGRITEVSEVMWNSAREAARDASLGDDNLQDITVTKDPVTGAVTGGLLFYLQSAEPTAFGKTTDSTTLRAPVSLPSNTTGYTCWDNTANRELFTITFTDLTHPSVTDPTGMSQLDVYQIGVQVPFSSIEWSPVVPIAGMSRISVAVVWTSMVDSPFQIVPNLPAQ